MGASPGTVSQQSAGGQRHPIVESVTTSTDGTGTTHNVTLPDPIQDGDLLLAFAAHANSRTIAQPSGWLDLYANGESPLEVGAMYKFAVGTEGGTTVQFTTSGSGNFAVQIFHISSWEEGEAVFEGGEWGEMFCPDLTTTWGAFAVLWINVLSAAMTGTYISNPPGYADVVEISTGSTSSDARVYTCRLQNESASESPGSWSFSSPVGKYVNFHIGIKGTTILEDVG